MEICVRRDYFTVPYSFLQKCCMYCTETSSTLNRCIEFGSECSCVAVLNGHSRCTHISSRSLILWYLNYILSGKVCIYNCDILYSHLDKRKLCSTLDLLSMPQRDTNWKSDCSGAGFAANRSKRNQITGVQICRHVVARSLTVSSYSPDHSCSHYPFPHYHAFIKNYSNETSMTHCPTDPGCGLTLLYLVLGYALPSLLWYCSRLWGIGPLS